jgi:hypothetical protein
LKDGLVSATLVLFVLNETRGVDGWWRGREEERKEENAESNDETSETRQDRL